MVISTCIKLKTVDQRLTVVQQPILSSGDVGTVRVEYELDSYWEGFVPSGTFYTAENPKDVYEQILVDGACVIPWEALQNDGILFIGLRGVDASGLIKTAAPVRYRIEKGSPRGTGTTVDPTPDVYMQLLTVLAGGDIPVDEFLKIVQTTGDSDTAVMSQKAVTEALAKKSENSGGLTAAQISALDELFKIATYTANASSAYTAFKNAFGIGESGGGDEPVIPDEPDIPDHTHSYTSSVTKAATCETAGVRTYTCSCGNSYTEVIPATGHNYVDGVCTNCGAVDPEYGSIGNVLLHNWDLTKSLTDTVGGVTATLNGGATQDSNGVKLDADTDWLNFPVTAWAANRIIEVDIASYDRKNMSHARVMMMYNHQARVADSGLIYRNTGYWQVYGQASNWVTNTNYPDAAYISGKTAKAVVNSDCAVSWYIGDAQIAENVDYNFTMTNNNGDASLYIGSFDGKSAYNLVVTGVRIYEGVQ